MLAAIYCAALAARAAAQPGPAESLPSTGSNQIAMLDWRLRVHDPSTPAQCKNEFWIFSTGSGIKSLRSPDLVNWSPGPPVFTNAPAWTRDISTDRRNSFWAPDVIQVGGRYLLYYSVSTWGKNTSAIGLASNATLDPDDPSFEWKDEGIVVRSFATNNFNTIDPAVTLDADGRLWLAFGSYWSGIKLVELDPTSGKRITSDSPMYSLAWHESIEASFLWRHGTNYYLFVNWGQCCRGTNSTYEIRVGRSGQITGPYFDREGKDLLRGGGTLFLRTSAPFYGPGHAGIITEGKDDWLSCHFYDGETRGRATLAIRKSWWDAEGWPVVSDTFSEIRRWPPREAGVIPKESRVDEATMQSIYDAVKTPFKYGVVLRGAEKENVDCPNVFRHGGKWWMIYAAFGGRGYETRLATSDDLLSWKTLGAILKPSGSGWDAEQAAGGLALMDHRWDGSWKLEKYRGKYWLSYLGGARPGYETPPLSIGLANTDDPVALREWKRASDNPILTPGDAGVRWFERDTLFKSQIIHDTKKTTGHPFVMFYNAREATNNWTERIGMAVSDDMIRWRRFGAEPVIDNGPKRGISGDPQIVKLGDTWVMFYFGAFWRPKAFDTFAASRALVHWTKWTGQHLIEPSEPWDKTFAHKPWLVRRGKVVYHFYCAVGDQGRVIAVATSRNLRVEAGGSE